MDIQSNYKPLSQQSTNPDLYFLPNVEQNDPTPPPKKKKKKSTKKKKGWVLHPIHLSTDRKSLEGGLIGRESKGLKLQMTGILAKASIVQLNFPDCILLVISQLYVYTDQISLTLYRSVCIQF